MKVGARTDIRHDTDNLGEIRLGYSREPNTLRGARISANLLNPSYIACHGPDLSCAVT